MHYNSTLLLRRVLGPGRLGPMFWASPEPPAVFAAATAALRIPTVLGVDAQVRPAAAAAAEEKGGDSHAAAALPPRLHLPLPPPPPPPPPPPLLQPPARLAPLSGHCQTTAGWALSWGPPPPQTQADVAKLSATMVPLCDPADGTLKCEACPGGCQLCVHILPSHSPTPEHKLPPDASEGWEGHRLGGTTFRTASQYQTSGRTGWCRAARPT